MKTIFKYLILAVFLFNSGCAAIQVSQRSKEYKAKLDSLLGCSKDKIIMEMGIPVEIKNIAGYEVYCYYQSYGGRGGAYVVPGQYISTAGAQTWEAYDKINIYLKDDIFIKWDGYIQR